MRSPSAEPTLGSDYLIKAVVAAIIGGLGSFTGAVVGGLALGLAEVMLRGYLPEGVWERLTDAFVFVLIAALFVDPAAGAVHRAHRGARRDVRSRSRPRLAPQRRAPARCCSPCSSSARIALHGHRRGGAGPARPGAARQPRARPRPAGVHRPDRDPVLRPPGVRPDRRLRARRWPRSPWRRRRRRCPDLPFGLGDVELGSVGATVVGVVVAVALGAVVGVAVARAGGLAATMITLAVLFVVDQGVKNWQELTRGAGGLSGVPRHGTNTWLWIAVARRADRRQRVPGDARRVASPSPPGRTRSPPRRSASTASGRGGRRGS